MTQSFPRPGPRNQKRRGFLVAALALLLPPTVALAEPTAGYVVVVHPGSPERLERSFVADVFLKKRTRWPGDRQIRPVDQKPANKVRRLFSEGVLQRSLEAVRSYWQQRIFSGRDVPPPELDSDEAVLRYVAKNPGAIGYVAAGHKLDGVKAVQLD